MNIIQDYWQSVKRNKDGFIFGGIAGVLAFLFISNQLDKITLIFQFQSLFNPSLPSSPIIIPKFTTMFGFFLIGSSVGTLVDESWQQPKKVFK